MSRQKRFEAIMNEVTSRCIYNRFKNLALNMFEWDGLPESMLPEYVEGALYTFGRAIFFRDPKQGIYCLPCTPSGGINVYGQHMRYRANGYGYNEEYDISDCVLIRNNPLMTNTHDYIMMYTMKLAEIERALDLNVKIQKFPFLITCDDKDLLTMKNIMSQIQETTVAIYADKNLRRDAIEILETKAPFVCDKLSDYRHDVTNEIMTFLGINNANTDKRERLVTDEVNANNDQVQQNALYMLNTRERACEEINAMFDLEVSVKLREGDQDNGDVHDDGQGTGGQGD